MLLAPNIDIIKKKYFILFTLHYKMQFNFQKFKISTVGFFGKQLSVDPVHRQFLGRFRGMDGCAREHVSVRRWFGSGSTRGSATCRSASRVVAERGRSNARRWLAAWEWGVLRSLGFNSRKGIRIWIWVFEVKLHDDAFNYTEFWN